MTDDPDLQALWLRLSILLAHEGDHGSTTDYQMTDPPAVAIRFKGRPYRIEIRLGETP